ncbi:ATP-binding protein [Streptomyces sp. NBC_00038]|uniref:ATP-binding protein n=1 Tax=Streptomyces sp. NBC_00038 TaxID=2903615 RepID=UPI002258C6B0|nr:ATP-binding protein [Streptomyces sp. NBC_00038]MCX5557428.1 ATP-binding protein [Streptomyces sp. NBC_00038]
MLPTSVRLARLHARRRLTLWNWEGNTDDAVLITSELVANGVRHGRCPRHELWLRLAQFGDGSLLIEVSDPVSAFPNFTETAPRDLTEEHGRGLSLVRALTTELTWSPRRHIGRTVRARMITE